MHGLAHKSLRRLVRPLVSILALVALLYFAQVLPHAHANGQDEAACRLCQVGHIGVTPAISAPTLVAPFVSFGTVVALPELTASQTFSEHSPSRAPPSIEL